MSVVHGWVRPGAGFVCPECGFDFDACGTDSMPETVRGFGRRYRAPLTRGLPGEDLDALVRTRPSPQTWSALEYAAHVRDAFSLSDYRITKALSRDRPSFRVADRDAAAIERSYNTQDPGVVLQELEAAAAALATTLAAVPPDGWDRVGVADGDELSVRWLGRNAVHEGSHHLLDIAKSVRAARGR